MADPENETTSGAKDEMPTKSARRAVSWRGALGRVKRLAHQVSLDALRRTLVAWVALAVGITVSCAAYVLTKTSVDRAAQLRFEADATAARNAIESNLRSYTQILIGLRALFSVDKELHRDEFHRYVASLNLAERYPGFRSLNFARYVRGKDRIAYENRVRNDRSLNVNGYPEFRIRPSGDRPYYYVIEFVYDETFHGEGRPMMGVDLSMVDSARSQVLDKAADTGRMLSSGLPIKVSGGIKSPVLAMRLPVYRTGASLNTVEERRRAIVGSVGAAFSIDALLQSSLNDRLQRYLRARMYDGGPSDTEQQPAARQFLFDSETLLGADGTADVDPAATMKKTIAIQIAGRRWEIDFTNRETYTGSTEAVLPMSVLFGGFAASFLLFGLLRSLASSRARAVELAEHITQDLRESEQRLRLMFENMPLIIYALDAENRVVLWNREAERTTGYSADEVVGDPRFAEYWFPDPEYRRRIVNELLGQGLNYRNFEIDLTCKDGSVKTLALSCIAGRYPIAGLAGGWGIGVDITERKQAEKKILHMAHYDELTGLSNRFMFNQRLEHALEKTLRYNKLLAVLFIDLDRFKNINDTLGHGDGDKLLKAVAKRLVDAVRRSDAVARMGGDEFVVLLEESEDAADIAGVARKLLASLTDPFTLDGMEYSLSASIGISIAPTDGSNIQTLLKNADIAMYRAKDEGRNNFQFYSAQMNMHSLERLAMESSLRHALERNEFSVAYQPKLNLDTGRIDGMEALLRWKHPDLGLVLPSNFIPLAEETGLIEPIGQWVLQTAWTATQDLYNRGIRIRVAVNLSPRQFANEFLVQHIQQLSQQRGLRPDLLELEVTESMVMQHAERAIRLLRQLREMGVTLAMDDFGTGYSSLAYLKQFPIDSVKIDRSFIHGIPEDAGDVAITKAILAMARSLNIRVIAEGVETEQQLEFLRLHQCDGIQGYYFSRPLTIDQIAQRFTKVAVRR